MWGKIFVIFVQYFFPYLIKVTTGFYSDLFVSVIIDLKKILYKQKHSLSHPSQGVLDSGTSTISLHLLSSG